MRYGLDSSAAFKWYVAEPDSARALRLRDDARAGLHHLIAPDHFPAEVANALWVAERRGRLAPGEFQVHLAALLTELPALVPGPQLLPRAAVIATTYGQSVYDCLYVALAEREGCELVTADDQLVRNLRPQFPFIVPLAALP
ncbi:MAG TPA: type II toxin-antitoxin system VapC family toxin [Gemmataceae bacterium]|jgi:predicted nucleic acid-binding protein